jgi:hypothetical protein
MPKYSTQEIFNFDRSASRRNFAVIDNTGTVTIEIDISDDQSGEWVVTDTVGLSGAWPMSTVASRIRFTPLGGATYYIAAQPHEHEATP